MLGRNKSKPPTTMVSQGEEATRGPRPVHLIDGTRTVTTQR